VKPDPSPTLASAFAGKKVLLTGHTGFKGAWLSEWLLSLGAQVTGASLPPPTQPNLFDQLGLASRLDHRLLDVRDPSAMARLVSEIKPDFVLHLAAQPLVRLSYSQPLETYATNVLGTAHVLDALRFVDHPCTGVFITTDKCYENREWNHGYRETDPLGGHDPYSSSKAAAEIIIQAYRRSYFSKPGGLVKIASARAGNVIGGGDWALDRIVPDAMRALAADLPIHVRNPHATRPWQHVLEPLGGYLWLAARLAAEGTDSSLATGFNFGPSVQSNQSVRTLVEEILKSWPGRWKDDSDPHAVHEATLLHLSTDQAWNLLRWQPVWNFAETIHETVSWYRKAHTAPASIRELTQKQILAYTEKARNLHLPWSL
jgi:CDP-glucose 4,6-dehydratase